MNCFHFDYPVWGRFGAGLDAGRGTAVGRNSACFSPELSGHKEAGKDNGLKKELGTKS
jgi:hypothetical protein